MKVIRKETNKIPVNSCGKCDFKSKLRFSLRRHEKIHLLQLFKCDYCDYKGKTKKVLQIHVNTQHPKRNTFQCEERPLTTYCRSSTLKKHIKSNPTAEEIQYFCCEHCSYKAKRKNNLNEHIRLVHLNQRPFSCTECSSSFKRSTTLKDHILRKHAPYEEKKKKYFYCDQCDYGALTKSAVKTHVIQGHTHPDLIKWFICPHCKSKFKIKQALNSHIKRMHPGGMKKEIKKQIKILQCEECTFTTYKSSTFKQHIISNHTPDEEIQYFYCGHCSYKAKRKNTLNQHIHGVHFGERPFRCTECSLSFYRKHTLKLHTLRKHVPYEEKKRNYFYCEQCDYGAVTRNAVKIHIIEAHTHPDLIKWFQCPYCTSKFKMRKGLKDHMKRHAAKMKKEAKKRK